MRREVSAAIKNDSISCAESLIPKFPRQQVFIGDKYKGGEP
jgi:hypothetical protein